MNPAVCWLCNQWVEEPCFTERPVPYDSLGVSDMLLTCRKPVHGSSVLPDMRASEKDVVDGG